MDLSDIEMFLIIARTKSISKAADALFLSQPTVSQRLKAMEQELNYPLMRRSKGFKGIELTQEGSDFVPIAERMLSLWKETKLLQHNRDRNLLNIGCTDSVNVALLAPFYRELLRQDPSLDLNIQTHHSSELYGLLDNHDIDVAFVFYHLYYKNIISQLVFQEKFYLVQPRHPAVPKAVVHTEELDPAMELFLKWDDPYQLWHDQWLTNYARPHFSTDIIALIEQLWEDERCWMIAPESVVFSLCRSRPLYISQLKNPPPDRCCYKITHRFPLPTNQDALSSFEQKLDQYLTALRFPIPTGQVWQHDATSPAVLQPPFSAAP